MLCWCVGNFRGWVEGPGAGGVSHLAVRVRDWVITHRGSSQRYKRLEAAPAVGGWSRSNLFIPLLDQNTGKLSGSSGEAGHCSQALLMCPWARHRTHKWTERPSWEGSSLASCMWSSLYVDVYCWDVCICVHVCVCEREEKRENVCVCVINSNLPSGG